MEFTLTLAMVVGLVPATITIPLLLQHLKRFVRFCTGSPEGSAYPLLAVLIGFAYTHALHRAALLSEQVGGEDLNAWAVSLIGLTIGAIAPLGYDGWKRYRPSSSGGGASNGGAAGR